jgi:hypothetical protein
MIVGVMKDYKLKQRDLRASHTRVLLSGAEMWNLVRGCTRVLHRISGLFTTQNR